MSESEHEEAREALMSAWGILGEAPYDKDVEEAVAVIVEYGKALYLAGQKDSQAERDQLRDLALKTHSARTSWLEEYGVPISHSFADFADVLGELIERALGPDRPAQKPDLKTDG